MHSFCGLPRDCTLRLDLLCSAWVFSSSLMVHGIEDSFGASQYLCSRYCPQMVFLPLPGPEQSGETALVMAVCGSTPGSAVQLALGRCPMKDADCLPFASNPRRPWQPHSPCRNASSATSPCQPALRTLTHTGTFISEVGKHENLTV